MGTAKLDEIFKFSHLTYRYIRFDSTVPGLPELEIPIFLYFSGLIWTGAWYETCWLDKRPIWLQNRPVCSLFNVKHVRPYSYKCANVSFLFYLMVCSIFDFELSQIGNWTNV